MSKYSITDNFQSTTVIFHLKSSEVFSWYWKFYKKNPRLSRRCGNPEIYVENLW